MTKINELFQDDIHRRIEKVISYQAVEQLQTEISEYVITETIEDNLTKGASGQAIQNLNVRLGWGETTGLEQAPMFP